MSRRCRVALAWTYNAATGVVRAYVNGQESGACSGFSTSPNKILAPTDMWIGKSGYAADPYLTATLRDFKIFRKTLA